MSSIAENLKQIREQIPSNVTLVAVSKTKPNEAIIEAYNAGQREFGENRVQELVAKSESLPADIEWHMIGHLQTNKVKYIIPFVNLIHSIDSVKLLKEVNKQARNSDRVIKVLRQFHIAKESTKFGFDLNEAVSFLNSSEFKALKHIDNVGVMGMATFTDDESIVHDEFKSLKSIFETLRNQFFNDEDSFEEISMGMSGDYELAIEEGSTMIRVGSSIFGIRG